MAKWKYELGAEGKILREMIDGEETIENVISIYNQLIKCLKYCLKQLSAKDKEFFEYDFESMIEDFECARPESDDEEIDYYDERDNLNYCLRDFYDLCDSARVWIGI